MNTAQITLDVSNDDVFLAGLPLFSGNKEELEDSFASMVLSGEQHLVVTANVDQIIDLSTSYSLNQAYKRASLRLVDGMPIVALAHILGAKNLPRHTGADLLPEAAYWSAKHGWKVAIVGGETSVGEAAAALLTDSNPGSQITHVDFPLIEDVTSEDSASVIKQLNEIRPQIVFTCLGSPKQENWVTHWSGDLPSAVFVGAGAAVDFAAGKKIRAPKLFQRLGLEWFWRLTQEPRRLGGRYLLKGPKFLFVVFDSLKGARA